MRTYILIQFVDVTGLSVNIHEDMVRELILQLPPTKQRFAKVIANTIKTPHEIWQTWKETEPKTGEWVKSRTYIQYLDLSNTDVDFQYGAAIAQFNYLYRWELVSIDIELGEKVNVDAILENAYRIGDIQYSILNH